MSDPHCDPAKIQKPFSALGIIDIRRAVQGNQRIAEWQAVHLVLLGGWQETNQRIDHHIPDPWIFSAGMPFVAQIRVAVFRRGKQQVCQLICYQPVYFFRHGAIKRTQACSTWPTRPANFEHTNVAATVEFNISIDQHDIRPYRSSTTGSQSGS